MATTNIWESSTHTRSVKNTLKHTWVIDNFSRFYFKKQRTESTASAYPRLTSTSFQCLEDERIQFRIDLYPHGNNEETKEYIAVYLYQKLIKAAQIPIKFKLSILSAGNQIRRSFEFSQILTETASKGWRKFVKRTALLNQSNGLLVNDQLTILCEIELYCEPVSKLAHDVCLENLKSQAIVKSSEMYGNLLESGDQNDVTLVFADEELKAHKAILSASSPVFKAMFEADMMEKTEGRVVIEDLSTEVAKELLKFIYTGKVDSLDTLAEELLTAADKYGLDLLKQISCEYLCGQVTTSNAGRLLALADAHLVDTLKSTCVEYIRGHLAQVMLTEDWPLYGGLVIEEMRKEELPQEDDVEVEEEEEE